MILDIFFEKFDTCRVVASTRCSEEDDEARRIRELMKMSSELAGKMSFANSLGPVSFRLF